MQSSYVLLLDDRLKPLGHFADEALQAASDYDVFRLISVDWVLGVKRSLLLKPLRNLWDENLQEYLQQCKKAKKRAFQQVKNAYTLIRQRLHSKQLFKSREIVEKLSSIEQILNGEETVLLQPHYEVADEHLQSLLLLLLNNGNEGIFADVAKIHYPNEKIDPRTRPYIHSLSYTSFIF